MQLYKKRKSSYISLLLILVAGLIASGLIAMVNTKELKPISGSDFITDPSIKLTIPTESGFYRKFPLSVPVSSNRSGTIHYTLDGTDPDPGSPVAGDNIRIPESAGDKLKNIPTSPRWQRPNGPFPGGIVLKAKLFTDDGHVSETVTRSFLPRTPGSWINSISIAVDPDDFFSYMKGIYVMGKAYEDKDNYARKKVKLDEPWWNFPANYQARGENAIRPCYYEDVTNKIGCKGTIRIHGNATRGFSQKSLRLSLPCAELSDSLTAVNLNLILRNSGNDWSKTLIRDHLANELIHDHSQIQCSRSKPSQVFLNGEYWGIHWSTYRLDEKFLAANYSLNENDLSIIQFPGKLFFGKPSAYADFMKLVKWLNTADLSDPQVYRSLQTKLDVNDFIDYILFESYFGNTDWPANNVRIWRMENLAGKDSSAPWRFLVFDMDYAFGYAASPETNPFPIIEKNKVIGLLFTSLSKNEEFRKSLITRYEALEETSFKPEWIAIRVDSIAAVLEPDIEMQIKRWRKPESIQRWREELRTILNFSSTRKKHYKAWLIGSLKAGSKTTVN